MRNMRTRPLSDKLILFAIMGLVISGILTANGLITIEWGLALIILFLIFIIAGFTSIHPLDSYE